VFFLLFARYFPVLALNEIKSILKTSGESYKNDSGNTAPKPTRTPELEKSAVEEANSETLTDEGTSDLLKALGTGSAENKDDLKKLSGVGPALEKTLNNAGIWSFDQVSKMTKKEYDIVDGLIGKFHGKAEKNDWAGQARELMNKTNNQ
jgi:molybdopterin-containing oxidoreductase family membrane subunit